MSILLHLPHDHHTLKSVFLFFLFFLKFIDRDFPGSLVVKKKKKKKSTCQHRGHRFDRWSRKTPHGTEHLTLCAATAEPKVPKEKPQQ